MVAKKKEVKEVNKREQAITKLTETIEVLAGFKSEKMVKKLNAFVEKLKKGEEK